MAKPEMPNLPGAAVMTDTLDFVKNLWGSMNVPGMTGMTIPGMNIPGITAPTLSVEELEKKINELKAVESWLTLNMGMLRTTIQALEVQRGTIITLKSMGAALATAVKQPPAAAGKAQPEAAPFSSPFFQSAPHAAAAAPTPAAAPVEPVKAPAPPHADSAAHGAASQMANPAAWWNLLQDQFKQAVNTTMASDAIAGAAALASDAAAKFTKAAKAVTPPASAAAAPAAAAKAAAPAKKEPAKRVAAKPKATRPTKG